MEIKSFRDLNVYQNSFEAAMEIYKISKSFPIEEKYSLTDQVRRSSRSVCANIGEAWRKRRYQAAFVSKLSDAETEACETQVWVELAKRCGYLSESQAVSLDEECDHIIAQLVTMIDSVDK